MLVSMQGTYPLDTLRLRLAVDPGSITMRGAAATLLREGSQGAFFRGLGTGLAGTYRLFSHSAFSAQQVLSSTARLQAPETAPDLGSL